MRDRYPHLGLNTKSDIARALAGGTWTEECADLLLGDVLKNFSRYWWDNKKRSEPEKEKWVRNAKSTNLGKLLERIDSRLLASHDKILPLIIFGGIQKKNHILAAKNLLGFRKKRTLLKIDLKKFFEQIPARRVEQFFCIKCGCGREASRLLASLCCVPIGPKGSTSRRKTIARGFCTSSRLSVWCNLDTFLKLERLVMRELRGRDPRISLYVDDIGITASRTTKEEIEKLLEKIKVILLSDQNQKLVLHEKKTEIRTYEEGMEIFGIKLERNSLRVGRKSRWKMHQTKKRVRNACSPEEKKKEKMRLQGMQVYKNGVEKR